MAEAWWRRWPPCARRLCGASKPTTSQVREKLVGSGGTAAICQGRRQAGTCTPHHRAHTGRPPNRPGAAPAAEGCPAESLGLPPSMHLVPWAPQADLLGHPALRAFLTHGGVNSLYEAAYRGVPILCMPLGGDLFDNCAKVGARSLGGGELVAGASSCDDLQAMPAAHPATVTAPAAHFPNEHLVLCARVQAAAGGWGVKFDSRQLETPDSPKLAALLERVASEPSFKALLPPSAPCCGPTRAPRWSRLQVGLGCNCVLVWVAAESRLIDTSRRAACHPACSTARSTNHHTPLPVSADWIEFALALPPGTDLSDPAASLPWWRWACLDVWAAAAAVLLAGLGGAGLAVGAVVSAVRRRLGQGGKAKSQ